MDEPINLIELCESDPELANSLIKNIQSYPSYLNKQITHIPTITYVNKPLTTAHINRIVSLRGTHIRAYHVLFKNVTSQAICLKCNKTWFSEGIKSKNARQICVACGSSSIRIDQDFKKAVSSQIIRIQNLTNATTMSETIEIMLEGPYTNKFIPGDKLFINGIVFRKWRQLRLNEPMISKLCVRAISVIKEEEEDIISHKTNDLENSLARLTMFERQKVLINLLCAEIEGNNNVKLGVLLGLIGGGRSSRRKNIHVLLFGEAGTGKTQMLKAVMRLVTPTVFVNGIGTSDAGLTSCAMRTGKDWSLEAGAVVLADKGLCCIDQFHKLRVGEKSGLLEAMEQQTISVAKAGMVVSMNTRCAVFGSVTIGNGYNEMKKISENLNLSTPLVSRFDLIFGIFDSRDKQKDCAKADKVLKRGRKIKNKEWDLRQLKMYIGQARKKVVKIEERESEVLLKYYRTKRANQGSNEYNTIRMFEGLIRATEAHAKLMNSEDVTEEDVYSVIVLMETCVNGEKTLVIDNEKIFNDERYYQRIKQKIKECYNL